VRETSRPPDLVGELLHDRDTGEPGDFTARSDGRLKLWFRPDQEGMVPQGSYGVGADVAAGTGASNTAISVGSGTTGEKMAALVDPNIQPHEAGVYAVALARWFNHAMLVWENPGPGRNFGVAVVKSGYQSSRIYWERNEKVMWGANMGRPIKKSAASLIPGWSPNNTDNRKALYYEYRKALSTRAFVNRDSDALEECLQIVNTASGIVIHGSATGSQDPTGAKDNHGDRPTADALCWKVMQMVKAQRLPPPAPVVRPGSMAWRFEEAEREEREAQEAEDGMAKNRKEPGSSRLAPPHVDGVNNERVQRLLDALARSRQKMQPFREQRRTLVRQFVGQSYGDAVARQKTPLNLMRLATTIYRRQVAARSPQALVVPMDPSMAPVADDYELVLNSRLRKMKFEDSLREVTTHSMFGPGIMKIGLAPSGKEFETQLGTRKDPGKVFADCVDLDDAVWDMRAASGDRVQFFGDSYEMTIDALEAMGIKDVTPIQSAMTNNEQGDERDNDRGLHHDRLSRNTTTTTSTIPSRTASWTVVNARSAKFPAPSPTSSGENTDGGSGSAEAGDHSPEGRAWEVRPR